MMAFCCTLYKADDVISSIILPTSNIKLFIMVILHWKPAMSYYKIMRIYSIIR